MGPPPAALGADRRSAVEATAFVLVGTRRAGNPQPLLERPDHPLERIPHLLPGQLGLLGPQRLRALPGAGRGAGDGGDALGADPGELLAAHRPARRPLDRPRPDLLAVELPRPPRRSRDAGGDPLELALDPGRGRPGDGRRDPRHPLRRRLRKDHQRPPQRRPQRPRQPGLRRPRPLRRHARSRATARAPSRPPTGTIARTKTPQSSSPTPSRSPSQPSRASWGCSSTSP